MASDQLPYRFEATEHPYAGTTFVYYPGGRVITFRTEDPDFYFATHGHDPGVRMGNSTRLAMTPGMHASFLAVPLRIQAAGN